MGKTFQIGNSMIEAKYDIGDQISIKNGSELFLITDCQVDMEAKSVKYFISPTRPVGIWVGEEYIEK